MTKTQKAALFTLILLFVSSIWYCTYFAFFADNTDNVEMADTCELSFKYITLDGCEYVVAYQNDRAFDMFHYNKCKHCNGTDKTEMTYVY